MPTAVLLGMMLAQVTLPQVDEVAWLRGCWERHTPEGTVEMQWLSPRASSMLGVSRTIHGTTLADYELTVIRERGDRLSYEPHPSNSEPDLFLSAAIGERRVVFENLRPQDPVRVGYELTPAGRLLAWSERSREGQTRRIESAYDRVSCPGE
jgi:hypothetical protein